MAIFVLSRPLFTESLEGPDPDFAKFCYFVLSRPLQRAWRDSGPNLAKPGNFCIKRPLTNSFSRARAQIWPNSAIFGSKRPLTRARAQIWQNSGIFVISCPLQRAWKGPGPVLGKRGYFCLSPEPVQGPGLNPEPLQGANGLNPKPRTLARGKA